MKNRKGHNKRVETVPPAQKTIKGAKPEHLIPVRKKRKRTPHLSVVLDTETSELFYGLMNTLKRASQQQMGKSAVLRWCIRTAAAFGPTIEEK